MINIQYLGHSTFLIQFENHANQEISILIDPFISKNRLAADVDIDSLKPNYIFLTHGHFDHMLDVEQISSNCQPLVVANYEIVTFFGAKNISYFPLNIGGKKNFGDFTVRMVNAVHSSVLPDGTYGGGAGGFLFYIHDKILYFAGDTALTYDMKLIPDYYGVPDVAILPIGGVLTMDAEDACIASDLIGCDNIIGCHFETFEYIKIDIDKTKELFFKNGKSLELPAIKQIINIA